jgi:hypothetical protein
MTAPDNRQALRIRNYDVRSTESIDDSDAVVVMLLKIAGLMNRAGETHWIRTDLPKLIRMVVVSDFNRVGQIVHLPVFFILG